MVSVLLSALVARFIVSHMRDFFGIYSIKDIISSKKMSGTTTTKFFGTKTKSLEAQGTLYLFLSRLSMALFHVVSCWAPFNQVPAGWLYITLQWPFTENSGTLYGRSCPDGYLNKKLGNFALLYFKNVNYTTTLFFFFY